jgi:hypothetical protein
MKSGHVGVYFRKSTKNLPIGESMTLSIPEMLRTKDIKKQIETRASEVFVKAVERNIRAVLAK